MAIPFLSNVDLNLNELLNVKFQILASDPASPVEGQFWYNSTTDRFKYRADGVTVDLTADIALKAPLASPTFTGVPAVPTAAAGTNTTQAASTAYVIAEIAARFAANDAQTIKGGIDCSSNPNYPAADAGDTYRVTNGGKIGGASGPNVQIGDVLICFVDGSSAGTHAAVGANWIILQYNLDGALTTANIGSTVQAYSANLDEYAAVNPTAAGLALLDDADAAAQRTTLGLGNVDNTSDATKNAAAVTLTNKILTSPVINTPSAEIITSLTAETTIADSDLVMIYDASATALRKMTKANFVSGLAGGYGKYSALIGNNSATSFSITQATHGRAADSTNIVQVEIASTGERVYPDVTVNPANGTVTIAFAAAPATDAYRVHIHG